MASIFKRQTKNGTIWRVVVRLKDYPTVCESFKRKQEALDWAQSVEKQIREGGFSFDLHRKNHTLSDLIDRFVDEGMLQLHKSAKDTKTHLNYWKSKAGSYGLRYLTTQLLSKQRTLLAETPTHRNTTRSAATVNRYMSSLSSVLSYAKDLSWIAENPCFRLKKLNEGKGRERILATEEAISLLEQCKKSKNTYLYCIVLLAITTGMRKGEILSLRWSDIDLENNLAHITETKNGKPRSVPLIAEIIVELQKIDKNRENHKILIFASRTAFGRIDINKAWKNALLKVSITNFRFHDLRHTFASLSARQGASNLELSTAMGHKTLQMLQRYTHLEGNLVRKYSEGVHRQITQTEKEK